MEINVFWTVQIQNNPDPQRFEHRVTALLGQLLNLSVKAATKKTSRSIFPVLRAAMQFAPSQMQNFTLLLGSPSKAVTPGWKILTVLYREAGNTRMENSAAAQELSKKLKIFL